MTKRYLSVLLALLTIALLPACGSSSSGSGGGAGGGGGSGGGSGGGIAGCDSSNCLGCCFNGACQPGNTNSACGKGGAACFSCNSPSVCKGDQTCGIDPNSMWLVQPVSAQISTTNAGGAWDVGGGAPDPMVFLWCPANAATSVSTSSVSDTFNPTWSTGGCSVKASDLLSLGFAMQVEDEDVTVNDIIAGKGTIMVTESNLQSGFVDGITNNTTLITLRVNFTKQ